MKTIFKQLLVVCVMFVGLTATAQTTAEEYMELGDELVRIEAYEQAVNCYSWAADKGNSEAYYKLGLCFANGYGVDCDAAYGKELINYSAIHGFVQAQYMSALISHSIEDYESAVFWLEMAVEQGNADAQCLLGLYYMEGMGVEKDCEMGIDLIYSAARKGNEEAIEFINEFMSE